MNKSRLTIAGILTILAVGLVVVQQARPQGGPPSGPTITWSVSELNQVMFPGTSSTTTVSFRSTQPLMNVAVEATPSLLDIVSITPANFASIIPNQDYKLTVTLKAPPRFQKRSFGGTLHVRSTDRPPRTYATPLLVSLNSNFISLIDAQISISLSYPVSYSKRSLNTVSGSGSALEITSAQKPLLLAGGALPAGKTEDDYSLGTGLVLISYTYSVGAFNINQWLRDVGHNTTLSSVEPYSVRGSPAFVVKLNDEIGAGRPKVVVPRNGRVYVFGYESSYLEMSEEDLAGLENFYSIVQSADFGN